MERSACPKCSLETRGLGAAAIDLVRMVDIRLDRGKHETMASLYLCTKGGWGTALHNYFFNHV